MEKKEMPLLSIIIVSYNTKQITLDCLESIYKETDPEKVPFEIVLLDNASTDGSKESLQHFAKEHTNVVFIEEKENIGFGRGNNAAVKQAQGDYLLLLNSDIVVLDRGIEKLYQFYIEEEAKVNKGSDMKVGFVGGKLFNKDMTPQASAAPFYSLPVVFAALFLRGDYWGLTRNSPDTARRVGWVSGACIIAKKEYYQALQGFDEDIFMYMEEVDLLYRAKKAGYSCFFCPSAHFIHLGSASSTTSNKRTAPILQVYRGFLYLYKKHYSRPELILLRFMLKLKAGIGIVIGRLFKNNYLITTYEEAFKLVTMD